MGRKKNSEKYSKYYALRQAKTLSDIANIGINVKEYLSVSDTHVFVNEIADAVCSMNYMPEIFDMYSKYMTLLYFTDIVFPEIGIEEVNDIVYGTPVVKYVMDNVNMQYYNWLLFSAKELISARLAENSPTAKLCNMVDLILIKLSGIIDKIAEDVNTSISNFNMDENDVKKLKAAVDKISGITDSGELAQRIAEVIHTEDK